MSNAPFAVTVKSLDGKSYVIKNLKEESKVSELVEKVNAVITS